MQGPWGAPPPGLPGVLAYHKVGTAELGGTWCGARQFAAHLDGLLLAGYCTVDVATFQAALANLDSHKAAHDAANGAATTLVSEVGRRAAAAHRVLVTFDDAFESFAAHAWPALKQRGMQALLFVVTGFVGRTATWDLPLPGRRVPHLSWSALRDLVADGVEIGSHSVRHLDLRRLSAGQRMQELQSSQHDLEDKLGVEVRSLSWPFGCWNVACCQAARQCGYQIGFAMSPAGRNDQFNGMAVPRRGVYVSDGTPAVLDKLDVARAGFWFQDLFTRGVGQVAALATRFQKDG